MTKVGGTPLADAFARRSFERKGRGGTSVPGAVGGPAVGMCAEGRRGDGGCASPPEGWFISGDCGWAACPATGLEGSLREFRSELLMSAIEPRFELALELARESASVLTISEQMRSILRTRSAVVEASHSE
eukprot:scaffold158039_cov29-Tisochrysis_lutea.AAC.5